MSPRERALALMAYADGELEGAELEEVEAWIARDAKAVRLANELADLGDLVKTGYEGSADAKAVAAFDITAAVMADVEKEKVRKTPTGSGSAAARSERPAAAVASLDAARARRQRNLKIGGVVAAALALAASVFLFRRNQEEVPLARGPVPTVEPASPAGTGPGIDVDIAETPGQSVSVFYLPSESSVTTTSVVVWVDESGGK